MHHQVRRIAAGIGAVAALGLGGSAIAGATTKGGAPPTPPVLSQPAQPSNSSVDGDTVQQGDQSSPDSETATAESNAPSETAGAEASSESGSEQAGNDGPGGHADEPANANADHQFDGQE